VLDLDTAAAKEAPKPDWCQESGKWGCGTAARCAGSAVDVDVPDDIGTYQPFAEDGALIVLGRKRAGTPIPWLIGIDTRTHAIKWNTTVAPDPLAADSSKGASGDLAGGRFVATYALAGKGVERLTAFDVETGARLWDLPVPARMGLGPVVVSRSRLYVRVDLDLAVRDPKDGRLLGKFEM